MPNLKYYLIVTLAGALLPLQAGINSIVGRQLKASIWASFFNFIIGTLALATVALVFFRPPPTVKAASGVPWWAWLGGLIGAFYVFSATVSAPRIGTAALTAAGVCGSMLAAMILDHYALAGCPRQPASLGRMAGVAMVVAGVFVIGITSSKNN